VVFLSDGKVISLGVKVEQELAKEFHTEIVNKSGNTYGNTGNCVKEAIKLWIEKSKKERIQKEKSAEKKKK